MQSDLPIESALDTLDNGDKVKCITGLIAQLDQIKSNSVHNTYLIKKIKELRLVSSIINDLLCNEEVIHSPKRQQSKIKKSRIIFDKQLDLQLLKGSIAKIEQSIKEGLKQHQELHQKFQSIKILCPDDKDDDQFEHLDIMRLVQIYKSEMEYVNEYFNRIENNPNNSNSQSLVTLNQSYQEMLLDDNIVVIFSNLNQMIDDLENLKQKLVQYEEFESQSTNFENSRNSSTNEKHFPRSKSQTYEFSEQQRTNVLKEITNEIKEKSSDTCINCSIF